MSQRKTSTITWKAFYLKKIVFVNIMYRNKVKCRYNNPKCDILINLFSVFSCLACLVNTSYHILSMAVYFYDIVLGIILLSVSFRWIVFSEKRQGMRSSFITCSMGKAPKVWQSENSCIRYNVRRFILYMQRCSDR